MVAYGKVVIMLIKQLKLEFTDATQPWCSDDVSALDTLARIELYFN